MLNHIHNQAFFKGLTLVTVKIFWETKTISSIYQDGHKVRFQCFLICSEDLLYIERRLEKFERLFQSLKMP